jgi:hypothetical protein
VSKSLGPKSRGLSTYEKEYVAILLTVYQWRSYLQFQEFIIATDHKSLSHLTEQRLHTHWQQKVFSKLLGLQYKIIYKKRVDNKVADALSRLSANEDVLLSCCAVSVCQPKWLEEVANSYATDASIQEIIAKLMVNGETVPNYTWKDGIL